MPVSVLEAKMYALLLLKFEMDEAARVAERGNELAQFLARVDALTFNGVVNALGLPSKMNRNNHTAKIEVIIQVRTAAWMGGGVRAFEGGGGGDQEQARGEQGRECDDAVSTYTVRAVWSMP